MNPETDRRYEVKETHLVNRDAGSESPFCGVVVSDDDCIGVRYYLRARIASSSVGSICQECKVLSMPLVREIIESKVEDLEARGLMAEAEDYQELGKTLARETGQNWRGD